MSKPHWFVSPDGWGDPPRRKFRSRKANLRLDPWVRNLELYLLPSTRITHDRVWDAERTAKAVLADSEAWPGERKLARFVLDSLESIRSRCQGATATEDAITAARTPKVATKKRRRQRKRNGVVS